MTTERTTDVDTEPGTVARRLRELAARIERDEQLAVIVAFVDPVHLGSMHFDKGATVLELAGLRGLLEAKLSQLTHWLVHETGNAGPW